MAYQREPMTCRCKRYVWKDDDPKLARWLDTKTQYRWSEINCPDCNTKCMSTGTVTYTDGWISMVSLPYRERDFYSRLTGARADWIVFDDMVDNHYVDAMGYANNAWATVNGKKYPVKSWSINIDPAKGNSWTVTGVAVDTEKMTKERKMLSVEECKQKLNEAVDNNVIKQWKFFPYSSDFWKAYGIEITYMDGATRSFTGNTNAHAHNQAVEYVAFITPKEKKVNRYSYDECFRIMRKAKKDGIIRGWGFCRNNSNVEQQPATWVEHDGLFDTKRFTDDGTKGDIGVLNEVVAYVNRLSKEHALKNAKPDTKDMTEKQLMEEIRNRGYHTGHTTHEKILPTFGLYTQNTSTGTSRPTGISWQSGETRHDFLAKCVDHIRKQK